jgi:hypothetical protein
MPVIPATPDRGRRIVSSRSTPVKSERPYLKHKSTKKRAGVCPQYARPWVQSPGLKRESGVGGGEAR